MNKEYLEVLENMPRLPMSQEEIDEHITHLITESNWELDVVARVLGMSPRHVLHKYGQVLARKAWLARTALVRDAAEFDQPAPKPLVYNKVNIDLAIKLACRIFGLDFELERIEYDEASFGWWEYRTVGKLPRGQVHVTRMGVRVRIEDMTFSHLWFAYHAELRIGGTPVMYENELLKRLRETW